jgi:hypothetical protein
MGDRGAAASSAGVVPNRLGACCGLGQDVPIAGTVISSDIANVQDFLTVQGFDGDTIVTNPPYA